MERKKRKIISSKNYGSPRLKDPGSEFGWGAPQEYNQIITTEKTLSTTLMIADASQGGAIK